MYPGLAMAAWRSFVAAPFYTAVNLLALTIGFTAAIFAGLYAIDDLSYDRWVPRHQDVFHVVTRTPDYRGQEVRQRNDSYRTTAAALKTDFPEIEDAARIQAARVLVSHNQVEAIEANAFWADPGFFAVFPLKALAGDLTTALNVPDGAVITRTIARKYFGNDAPVGEVLEISALGVGKVEARHEFRVTAVVEDLPSNSHLAAQIFLSAAASFSGLSILDARAMTPQLEPYEVLGGAIHYFRLRPGADIAPIQRGMPAFVQRHFPTALLSDVQLRLRPIADIHLDRDVFTYGMRPAGDRSVTLSIAAIGLLVVVASSINFINLMTARSMRRGVEIGVRKVSGGRRWDLIVQFMAEAMLYAAVAMIVSGLAVALLLPAFNGLVDRDIALDGTKALMLLSGGAIVVILVGALAGAYPALVLSARNPRAVLRQETGRAGAHSAHRYLVVLQFAILVGLLLATAVIYRQVNFALQAGLRLSINQVVIVGGTTCRDPFHDEVAALPGVEALACGWSGYLSAGYTTKAFTGGMEPSPMEVGAIDFGFLELYGLQPLAGRFFSKDLDAVPQTEGTSSGTNPNIVINETARRAFGFDSPEQAIGQTVTWARKGQNRAAIDTVPLLPSTIIGVVPDFPSRSLREVVTPTIYAVDLSLFTWIDGKTPMGHMHVKLRGDSIPQTLQAIDALWLRLRPSPLPLNRVFYDQQLEVMYRDVIRQGDVCVLFSVLAVSIAVIGLFGFAAFTAEQRTKEIGIRKAMGAKTGDILRLLIWQFSKPVLWANVIAWPAAYVVMQRWLEGFAYHVELEPWLFIAISALAFAIAVLTVAGHAWRVARTQPVHALRYE